MIHKVVRQPDRAQGQTYGFLYVSFFRNRELATAPSNPYQGGRGIHRRVEVKPRWINRASSRPEMISTGHPVAERTHSRKARSCGHRAMRCGDHRTESAPALVRGAVKAPGAL